MKQYNPIHKCIINVFKRSFKTIVLIVFAFPLFGQQIKINSGAYLNITGTAFININNGDFINNGTYAKSTETVSFSGNTAKTISGSSNTDLNNLTVTSTGGITTQLNQLTVNALTIASSSKFTIDPAKAVVVSGALTNSASTGGLVLKSDATGTASLIHNTNSVPATVERYISGDAEDWHFLSSPISNQSISGSWLPVGTYGNGTGYDLYLWNEPNSCWIYQLDGTSLINWTTVHPETDFVVGRGYLYSVQAANPTKEFVGNLNNGSLNYGLNFSSSDLALKGFNLVGNPYPSSIDWSSLSGWGRTNLTVSGGGYNMWIWNPAASNYGVFNSADGDGIGTNSVTQFIAPMQGFFVQTQSAGNLGVDNGVRVNGSASNWFKSQGINRINYNKFNLIVKSDEGYGTDEVKLSFGYPVNENGAKKLFSKVLSAPSLYFGSPGNYLSTQYLTSPEENTVVPIMFTPGKDGSYALNCNFDANNFEIVMLEDKKTHTFQDMKVKATYRFNASKSDDPKRFVLYFGSVKDVTDKTFPARVYTDGVSLIVDLTLISNETNVLVYNMMGILLLQKKLQGETRHLIPLSFNKQIIVVSLKNPNGSLVQKLLWYGN